MSKAKVKMSKAKMMCVIGCGAVLATAAITGCGSSSSTTVKVTKTPAGVVTPTHTPTVVPPPLTPTAPPRSSSTS
jgi:hypothetical protein